MTSPYPEGWFAILASDKIRPGEVAAAGLMNEDACSIVQTRGYM